MNNWAAKVLTLFPDMFPGPLGHSIAGRALADGLWSLNAIDIRSFAGDKHQTVDDTPFGGGPGMVMRPDVVDRALGEVMSNLSDVRLPVLYMSPRGSPLTQARVRSLSAGPGVVIVCGRYEGLDERVIEARQMEEVSLGDYILSGGELAALGLMDACVRLLPGVMGSDESPEEESFEKGLLEYPHYTRPRTWCDRDVPEVLLSGHHEKVRAWRQAKAEEITRERRPDLWDRFAQDRDPPRH
mgnify:CR=1 FL=1